MPPVYDATMPRVAMKMGAEFDFLSKDELDKVVHDRLGEFSADLREQTGETVTRSSDGFTTDSTGSTAGLPRGGGSVYIVPVGYDAYLTRLAVDYEGSNASSLASCDLRIVADQNTPSGLRSIAAAVPNVFAEGKSHAPLFRGGQHVVVCIAGGPASTKFYATAQVLLVKRRHTHVDVLAG